MTIVDLYSKLNVDIDMNVFEFRDQVTAIRKMDFDGEAGITLLVEYMETLSKAIKSPKEVRIETNDFELIDI